MIHCVKVLKLFSLVTDYPPKQASVFDSGKPIQPSLNLLTNITLVSPETNRLAYLSGAIVRKKLIALTPGANVIKHFTVVSYGFS